MAYEASRLRKWILPMSAIASVSVLAFAILYAVDHVVLSRASNPALPHYLDFDPASITDAVPALGGMIAAVLGIVITVVSIVVQLSANRYPGVATMFLRDRTNITVMGFYVVACVCGVLVSLSLRSDFVPHATVVTMMGTTTVGLVLMAPYFAYVFWFLEPANIIARIRANAVRAVRGGSDSASAVRGELAQADTVVAMEELTDITSNSISGKDKIIASRAVDALKDFAVTYIAEIKGAARPAWFLLGPQIRENPDFVAMEAESRQDLERRETWVEWKVMRQYLGIYNEALATMPDINYLIAIDTRYIGEAAAERGDDELIVLVLRYMNSYLRATLNAKSVRTAYNVLNQYRQLVEAMMRHDQTAHVAAAVEHMKYYGHVSYDMKLSFVTETVAYDIGTLCEVAHQLDRPEQDEVLATFLELDRATARKSQERALKGVRKAQTKLAAYFLSVGEREKARLIYHDMELDPPERLVAIREELDRVETKDFWEIIDRGRNFEFMPPEQKRAMHRFFSWFAGTESQVSPPRHDAERRSKVVSQGPSVEALTGGEDVPPESGARAPSPGPPPSSMEAASDASHETLRPSRRGASSARRSSTSGPTPGS
ncbi:MAG: DUF2254 family protein [Myxococcota bacterium]